jgi:murein DD-endopeptidase MepM/ murein hydrolase activator NlpD
VNLGSVIGTHVTRKLLTSKASLWLAQRIGNIGIKGASTTVKLGSKVIPTAVKEARVAKWGVGLLKDAGTLIKGAELGSSIVKLLKADIYTFIIGAIVGEWIDTWIEKETKYNNMIYIYPLWKMGEPFAAGITAAQHIIPGYIDPKFADPFNTGKISAPKGMKVSDTDTSASSSGSGATNSGSVTPTGTVIHPLLKKTTITSPYGWRTLSGKRQFHYGVDLAPVARGVKTPVYAVADGTIISTGLSSSMGNYVYLLTNLKGQPYVIVYMHMQNGSLLHGVNTSVKQGDQLGIMGTTGQSTGVHLHFEICKGSSRITSGSGDNRVDPVPLWKSMGVDL